MAMKRTPWSYRKGSSPLHRISAGFKLFFLLLLSLAAFLPGPFGLSAAALILVLLSFCAGINPLQLLRGSGALFFVVLAVFLLEGVEFSPLRLSTEGLLEALVFCVRIGTAFAAGSLLFAVTSPGEIRKSLCRAESFFGVKKPSLALSISLMLGFIPAFFQIWEDINLAWNSRGGRKKLRRLVILVPLLLERMMLKAADSASAMESRGALL